jgi:hypothetical protein
MQHNLNMAAAGANLSGGGSPRGEFGLPRRSGAIAEIMGKMPANLAFLAGTRVFAVYRSDKYTDTCAARLNGAGHKFPIGGNAKIPRGRVDKHNKST